MPSRSTRRTTRFRSSASIAGSGCTTCQSAKRLKDVRRDIDRVYALREDVAGLFAFAGDVMKAPESRIFAAAKLEALWKEATERRRERPLFNRAKLAVLVNALELEGVEASVQLRNDTRPPRRGSERTAAWP